jgi:hypothetical protein
VSPAPSTTPRSEADQIVLLTARGVQVTKELDWSRLKIQALEERLRLEMIRKYGPKSWNWNPESAWRKSKRRVSESRCHRYRR